MTWFKNSFLQKIVSLFIAFTFISTSIVPPSMAQSVLNLPIPGAVVNLTPSYSPMMIRGVMVHPEDSLKFDFIMDKGDQGLEGDAFNKEANKLVKYFLASLTIPENQMWVNLSPYEKDRIIPGNFSQTEMGRDLLAQDYMLKQLTASLMMPDKDLGDKFWKRVRQKAKEKFGTEDIALNTFNKIWIVPEKAQVYENQKGAFVVSSHLKVMLEEDYLALEANKNSKDHGLGNVKQEDLKPLTQLQKDIIKEVLIPEIEKEVNEGKTFANLRQIYSSMILATWYKKALKESLLGKVYVDKAKLKGVEVDDKDITQKIYNQYIDAFKKGVYDYIKEDYDPATQQVIPRKYFSGGIVGFSANDMALTATPVALDAALRTLGPDRAVMVTTSTQEITPQIPDAAMLGDEATQPRAFNTLSPVGQKEVVSLLERMLTPEPLGARQIKEEGLAIAKNFKWKDGRIYYGRKLINQVPIFQVNERVILLDTEDGKFKITEVIEGDRDFADDGAWTREHIFTIEPADAAMLVSHTYSWEDMGPIFKGYSMTVSDQSNAENKLQVIFKTPQQTIKGLAYPSTIDSVRGDLNLLARKIEEGRERFDSFESEFYRVAKAVETRFVMRTLILPAGQQHSINIKALENESQVIIVKKDGSEIIFEKSKVGNQMFDLTPKSTHQNQQLSDRNEWRFAVSTDRNAEEIRVGRRGNDLFITNQTAGPITFHYSDAAMLAVDLKKTQQPISLETGYRLLEALKSYPEDLNLINRYINAKSTMGLSPVTTVEVVILLESIGRGHLDGKEKWLMDDMLQTGVVSTKEDVVSLGKRIAEVQNSADAAMLATELDRYSDTRIMKAFESLFLPDQRLIEDFLRDPAAVSVGSLPEILRVNARIARRIRRTAYLKDIKFGNYNRALERFKRQLSQKERNLLDLYQAHPSIRGNEATDPLSRINQIDQRLRIELKNPDAAMLSSEQREAIKAFNKKLHDVELFVQKPGTDEAIIRPEALGELKELYQSSGAQIPMNRKTTGALIRKLRELMDPVLLEWKAKVGENKYLFAFSKEQMHAALDIADLLVEKMFDINQQHPEDFIGPLGLFPKFNLFLVRGHVRDQAYRLHDTEYSLYFRLDQIADALMTLGRVSELKTNPRIETKIFAMLKQLRELIQDDSKQDLISGPKAFGSLTGFQQYVIDEYPQVVQRLQTYIESIEYKDIRKMPTPTIEAELLKPLSDIIAGKHSPQFEGNTITFSALALMAKEMGYTNADRIFRQVNELHLFLREIKDAAMLAKTTYEWSDVNPGLKGYQVAIDREGNAVGIKGIKFISPNNVVETKMDFPGLISDEMSYIIERLDGDPYNTSRFIFAFKRWQDSVQEMGIFYAPGELGNRERRGEKLSFSETTLFTELYFLFRKQMQTRIPLNFHAGQYAQWRGITKDQATRILRSLISLGFLNDMDGSDIGLEWKYSYRFNMEDLKGLEANPRGIQRIIEHEYGRYNVHWDQFNQVLSSGLPFRDIRRRYIERRIEIIKNAERSPDAAMLGDGFKKVERALNVEDHLSFLEMVAKENPQAQIVIYLNARRSARNILDEFQGRKTISQQDYEYLKHSVERLLFGGTNRANPQKSFTRQYAQSISGAYQAHALELYEALNVLLNEIDHVEIPVGPDAAMLGIQTATLEEQARRTREVDGHVELNRLRLKFEAIPTFKAALVKMAVYLWDRDVDNLGGSIGEITILGDQLAEDNFTFDGLNIPGLGSFKKADFDKLRMAIRQGMESKLRSPDAAMLVELDEISRWLLDIRFEYNTGDEAQENQRIIGLAEEAIANFREEILDGRVTISSGLITVERLASVQKMLRFEEAGSFNRRELENHISLLQNSPIMQEEEYLQEEAPDIEIVIPLNGSSLAIGNGNGLVLDKEYQKQKRKDRISQKRNLAKLGERSSRWVNVRPALPRYDLGVKVNLVMVNRALGQMNGSSERRPYMKDYFESEENFLSYDTRKGKSRVHQKTDAAMLVDALTTPYDPEGKIRRYAIVSLKDLKRRGLLKEGYIVEFQDDVRRLIENMFFMRGGRVEDGTWGNPTNDDLASQNDAMGTLSDLLENNWVNLEALRALMPQYIPELMRKADLKLANYDRLMKLLREKKIIDATMLNQLKSARDKVSEAMEKLSTLHNTATISLPLGFDPVNFQNEVNTNVVQALDRLITQGEFSSGEIETIVQNLSARKADLSAFIYRNNPFTNSNEQAQGLLDVISLLSEALKYARQASPDAAMLGDELMKDNDPTGRLRGEAIKSLLDLKNRGLLKPGYIIDNEQQVRRLLENIWYREEGDRYPGAEPTTTDLYSENAAMGILADLLENDWVNPNMIIKFMPEFDHALRERSKVFRSGKEPFIMTQHPRLIALLKEKGVIEKDAAMTAAPDSAMLSEQDIQYMQTKGQEFFNDLSDGLIAEGISDPISFLLAIKYKGASPEGLSSNLPENLKTATGVLVKKGYKENQAVQAAVFVAAQLNSLNVLKIWGNPQTKKMVYHLMKAEGVYHEVYYVAAWLSEASTRLDQGNYEELGKLPFLQKMIDALVPDIYPDRPTAVKGVKELRDDLESLKGYLGKAVMTVDEIPGDDYLLLDRVITNLEDFESPSVLGYPLLSLYAGLRVFRQEKEGLSQKELLDAAHRAMANPDPVFVLTLGSRAMRVIYLAANAIYKQSGQGQEFLDEKDKRIIFKYLRRTVEVIKEATDANAAMLNEEKRSKIYRIYFDNFFTQDFNQAIDKLEADEPVRSNIETLMKIAAIGKTQEGLPEGSIDERLRMLKPQVLKRILKIFHLEGKSPTVFDMELKRQIVQLATDAVLFAKKLTEAGIPVEEIIPDAAMTVEQSTVNSPPSTVDRGPRTKVDSALSGDRNLGEAIKKVDRIFKLEDLHRELQTLGDTRNIQQLNEDVRRVADLNWNGTWIKRKASSPDAAMTGKSAEKDAASTRLEIDPRYLDKFISELNLSVRVDNVLRKNRKKRLSDINGMFDRQLLWMKYLGRKGLVELKEALKPYLRKPGQIKTGKRVSRFNNPATYNRSLAEDLKTIRQNGIQAWRFYVEKLMFMNFQGSTLMEILDRQTSPDVAVYLSDRLRLDHAESLNDPTVISWESAMRNFGTSNVVAYVLKDGIALDISDSALLVDKNSEIKAQSAQPTNGGIDLNPATMNMQIKRDGNGVPLPLNLQPIDNINIEGFQPIIINVAPINNLPLLLGIKTNPAEPIKTSKAENTELGYLDKAREMESVK